MELEAAFQTGEWKVQSEEVVDHLIRDLLNLDKLHLRRDAETLGDYCVAAPRALSSTEVDEAIARDLLKGGNRPKCGKQVRIRVP